MITTISEFSDMIVCDLVPKSYAFGHVPAVVCPV